jgi:anti-anti-sigma regulatory factor
MVTTFSATELYFCYLVRLQREIKQVRGTLKICDLSPHLADKMRMIRLDRTFSTHKSVDDARLDP